jgi:hypothetical protein
MKERSPITINVMKRLYPNKRLSFRDLNLNESEFNTLLQDMRVYGGFNKTRDGNNEIEELWLSNNGKAFIKDYLARHNYKKRFKDYIKNNYKWLVKVILHFH